MEYSIRKKDINICYSPSYKGNRVAYHRSGEEYRLKEGKPDFLHYHTCIEIGYCLKGSGTCCIDDREYRFGKGDMQIVMPYRPHYSTSDIGVDSRWVWMFIEPYRILGESGLVGASDVIQRMIGEEIGLSCIFHPNELPALAQIVRAIDREIAEQDLYVKQKIGLLVYQMCIELARESKRQSLAPPPVDPDLVRIMPVFHLIRENLDNNHVLTQENLAAACSVSVSHFRRLFTEVAGMSPKAYIVRARMSYAEYLLINTNHSILEISSLSGFENLSCFSRMFRKLHAVSPSEFRRRS